MSTRANVKVTDSQFGGKNTLWFYQHGDGYPTGIVPTLDKFMQSIADGKLRDNVEQACGRLIVLGREDAGDVFNHPGYDWKVGCIEPSTAIHDDIDYLYELDITKRTLTCKAVRYGQRKGNFTRIGFTKLFVKQYRPKLPAETITFKTEE